MGQWSLWYFAINIWVIEIYLQSQQHRFKWFEFVQNWGMPQPQSYWRGWYIIHTSLDFEGIHFETSAIWMGQSCPRLEIRSAQVKYVLTCVVYSHFFLVQPSTYILWHSTGYESLWQLEGFIWSKCWRVEYLLFGIPKKKKNDLGCAMSNAQFDPSSCRCMRFAPWLLALLSSGGHGHRWAWPKSHLLKSNKFPQKSRSPTWFNPNPLVGSPAIGSIERAQLLGHLAHLDLFALASTVGSHAIARWVENGPAMPSVWMISARCDR